MVKVVCPECGAYLRADEVTVVFVACKQHRFDAKVTLAELYGKERA